MPLISKPNYNQIFASQAPEQDKPAVFNNYPEGWGPESRPNNGKPTIKGFNYLQQASDLKDLWILQNGACLPYDESIEYAEGAPVLKDGVIQYKTASGFKSRDSVTIPTYSNAADGVDLVTGVADGAYFNVRSSNDESYIDEYQNVGGSAVATGKIYLSALGVQQQEKPASTIKDASGVSQQWVNDKKTLKTFYDFGAKGDGVTDDTTAIRLATVYSEIYDTAIVQDDGEFLVSTFDQTLSDGIICAIPLAGNLKLSGTGRIKSNQTGTTRTIFGIDERANGANISISGIKFTGAARYRAIHSTATAELSTLDVLGVRTARQSIVLTSDIKNSIRVKNNRIGEDITATTNVTPTVVVTIPQTSINFPEYDCSKNLLIGGTETTTGTSYAFHNIPPGGKADDNILVNIGKSQTEGYDIDGLGRMASFSRNVAIFSGFEYKVGSNGLVRSRDTFFHDNLSWESFGTAFAIRSSCNARGNIAYNPTSWGLWMGTGSDPDELLKRSAIIDVDAFKIIWAGSSWPGAVKIDAIVKAFDLKKLSVEIDPAYKLANPTAKIIATAGSILNIDGDFDNLAFDGLFVDDAAVDQVNIRPTTRAKNIHFFKPKFGACDDSCIDITNTDNFIVHDPEFPETAGDRPIRMSGCDLVDIKAQNFQNIDNLISTASIQYVTVNGYGAEPVGASGRPLGTKWRLGSIITNTFDGSIWLKVLASSGAGAWKKLTSGSVSVTYDPPSLATGQQQSTTVTVNGAVLGDMVACSFNRPLGGSQMWAEVTAADTVTVYHQNDTGAPLDIASGTLSVKLL